MQHRPDRSVGAAGFIFAACLIVLQILFVTRYCCMLQSQYYTHNGPFFDSVSYYNILAQIYSASRLHGPLVGFQDFPGRTSLLPWAEVGFIAQFRPLSRSLGIWLQAIWLLPLALSLLWYQIVKRNLDVLTAVAATIPFFGFRAIFHYDGGLCDFRMDLSLWIFYSLAAIWFLIASDSKSIAPWLLWGIFTGLGCLARPIAAFYFTVAFVPLIPFCAHYSTNRYLMLRGVFIGVGTALAICGWFFIANFQSLYQYYFVWNHDANRHLPLLQALQHFRLAFNHIGQPVAFYCFTFGILTIALAKPSALSSPKKFFSHLNWQALYLGCAPVILLIVMGAGLNPYVSMPAAFGLMLFLTEPLLLKIPAHLSTPIAIALVFLAASVVTASAVDGLASQTGPEASSNSMAAQKEIVNRILTDAAAHRLKSIRFSTGSYVRTTNASLTDVMIFEFAFTPHSSQQLMRSDLTISTDDLFQGGELVDWQKIPGTSDRDRINFLANRACQTMNYITFPDDRSLTFLKTAYADQLIDRYSSDLRDTLLRRGHWRTVGSPISGSKHETQVVYANDSLDHEPAPEK
jgi:hypothetical protein